MHFLIFFYIFILIIYFIYLFIYFYYLLVLIIINFFLLLLLFYFYFFVVAENGKIFDLAPPDSFFLIFQLRGCPPTDFSGYAFALRVYFMGKLGPQIADILTNS